MLHVSAAFWCSKQENHSYAVAMQLLAALPCTVCCHSVQSLATAYAAQTSNSLLTLQGALLNQPARCTSISTHAGFRHIDKDRVQHCRRQAECCGGSICPPSGQSRVLLTRTLDARMMPTAQSTAPVRDETL